MILKYYYFVYGNILIYYYFNYYSSAFQLIFIHILSFEYNIKILFQIIFTHHRFQKQLFFNKSYIIIFEIIIYI